MADLDTADLDTADLDAQIAQLEALKRARMAKAETQARAREQQAAKVLVTSTPTKAKGNNLSSNLPPPPARPKFESSFSAEAGPSCTGPARDRPTPATLPSLPKSQTNFAASLAAKRASAGDLENVRMGAERGADLTVTANLCLGPRDFGPDPEGEHEWCSVEPNSGIRLSKRVMPHANVQDYLYGRYFLPPSQVYSVARLSRDGATYDIPVNAEWVTIAVVAERSDVRVSGTKSLSGRNDHDDEEDDDDDGDGAWAATTSKPKEQSMGKGKGKDKVTGAPSKQRVPRKYLNLKLVSLPSRGQPHLLSNAASGDAHLQLLLFEAEAIVHGKEGEGYSHRGGSGGAYEKWCNLGVGSIIAIVNPRVLRPLKSGATPHPLALPLALNPTSAASVALIGQAMDLGRCVALGRDGMRCRAWIDSRYDQVCEYHASLALKRGRASRGELASATTPMEITSNKSGFDARSKTGLLPGTGPQADRNGGGATYVVGAGNVVHTGAAKRSGFASSPGDFVGALDRKRRRKADELAQDAAIARLMERDASSAGARYLRAAEALRTSAEEDSKIDGKGGADKRAVQPEGERRPVFSASAIQTIGYDPSARRGEEATKRAASIAALKASVVRPLKLGRPAGPKRLSNVSIPIPPYRAITPQVVENKSDEEEMIDLD